MGEKGCRILRRERALPGLGEGGRHSRRRRRTLRSVVSLGPQVFCGARTHWFSWQNSRNAGRLREIPGTRCIC